MPLHFASRLLTLFFLVTSIFFNSCLANCNIDDETGLLALKSGITQDLSGMLSSWKPGTDCCTWSGIWCEDSGRVERLSLNGEVDDPKRFLSGTISPSLSKLKFLTGIDFNSLRNLTGTFPTFLYDLPELRSVYIENNKLSGSLPNDFGKRLSKLEALSFTGNQFTGSIPSSISLLTELTLLKLDGNKLTGLIPDGIQRLTALSYLNLENNQLSGKIPDVFASFPELLILILSHNKLSGGIPTSISSLTPKLMFLEMGHNDLTGEIPDYFGDFIQLDTLDLSANKLTGPVPSSLQNLTKIVNLNLARNQLVDPFPELSIEGIESLDLSYNKFQLGQLPKWVATSPVIYSLNLAGCGLKFHLEDFKPMLTYDYNVIDLSDNQISGSLIELLKQTSLLTEFRASGNLLQFNMSNMVIPTSLTELDLSRNHVFGEVPKSISRLKKVDLSHNHLCGHIPTNKFSAQAFQGNDCLCGSPLPTCEK